MEHCPESRGCRRDRSTWSFGHPILHQPMKTPELNLSSPAACLPGNFVNSFHPFLECEQQLLRHPVDSIRFLVIHCSATRCNQAYTAPDSWKATTVPAASARQATTSTSVATARSTIRACWAKSVHMQKVSTAAPSASATKADSTHKDNPPTHARPSSCNACATCFPS